MKFPQLRNNRTLAKEAERALRTLEGVTMVEVSTVTGSLLIRYDAEGWMRDRMLASIRSVNRELGLVFDPSAPAAHYARMGSAAAGRLTEKLVESAVEKCIERSALLLLGALL